MARAKLCTMPFGDDYMTQTQAGTYLAAACFASQYAVPLTLMNDYTRDELDNRLVTEAMAGNFSANIMGMEQIVFTYMAKWSGSCEQPGCCFSNHTRTGRNAGEPVLRRHEVIKRTPPAVSRRRPFPSASA